MLLIRILEIILFVCFSVNILYVIVFSFASVFGKREKRGKREKEAVSFRRIAILVPAYKEDRVIMECVESCLRQDYPRDRYEVVVISDRMEPETNERLSGLAPYFGGCPFREQYESEGVEFSHEPSFGLRFGFDPGCG